jgi:hypothetical protein
MGKKRTYGKSKLTGPYSKYPLIQIINPEDYYLVEVGSEGCLHLMYYFRALTWILKGTAFHTKIRFGEN